MKIKKLVCEDCKSSKVHIGLDRGMEGYCYFDKKLKVTKDDIQECGLKIGDDISTHLVSLYNKGRIFNGCCSVHGHCDRCEGQTDLIITFDDGNEFENRIIPSSMRRGYNEIDMALNYLHNNQLFRIY